jgi:hypothetical protein
VLDFVVLLAIHGVLCILLLRLRLRYDLLGRLRHTWVPVQFLTYYLPKGRTVPFLTFRLGYELMIQLMLDLRDQVEDSTLHLGVPLFLITVFQPQDVLIGLFDISIKLFDTIPNCFQLCGGIPSTFFQDLLLQLVITQSQLMSEVQWSLTLGTILRGCIKLIPKDPGTVVEYICCRLVKD